MSAPVTVAWCASECCMAVMVKTWRDRCSYLSTSAIKSKRHRSTIMCSGTRDSLYRNSARRWITDFFIKLRTNTANDQSQPFKTKSRSLRINLRKALATPRTISQWLKIVFSNHVWWMYAQTWRWDTNLEFRSVSYGSPRQFQRLYQLILL